MKKIIALALAIMFVFVLAVPTFAEIYTDANAGSFESDGDPDFGTAPEVSDTDITYNMDGSYTVSIPASFTFANGTASDSQDVKVSNVMLGYGQKLVVSAAYDGLLKLKKEESVTLAYRLYKANGDVEVATTTDVIAEGVADSEKGFYDFDEVTTPIYAKVTGNVQYAGIYTAIVEFTIAVVEG